MSRCPRATFHFKGFPFLYRRFQRPANAEALTAAESLYTMKKQQYLLSWAGPTLLFASLLMGGGCQSLPVQRTSSLYQAASQLEEKAAGTITQIETTALENDIRRVVFNVNVSLLSQNDFTHAITPKAKVGLLQQLAGVTAYTKVLHSIASESYKGEFAAAVTDAKKAFDSSAASANELIGFASSAQLQKISANAATFSAGIAALGEAIISARAQKKATAIIAARDAEFGEYLRALADVFASSNNPTEASNGTGLAAMLANEISQRKVRYINEYKELGAPPNGTADRNAWLGKREAVARAFAAEVHSEGISVAVAIALRKACLSLAEAHHALATEANSGALVELETAIGRIHYLSKVFQETRESLNPKKS
jgi:hypothetical protein